MKNNFNVDLKTEKYSDFTLASYREVASMAVTQWTPASFREIPWGQRFCLWRHDVDFSMNRALKIAAINSDVGLFSTFFVNIHSESYNLHEKSQQVKLQEIAHLGHDIGIHFEASFYDLHSEKELGELVAREAEIVARLSGVSPGAFSFHNPRAIDLTFESDRYGGLVNAYSKRLKTEVAYCSDSNGYWRYERLFDVVSEGTDLCLQVLTHPGWWQDQALTPRQRVFRSTFGRARAVMSFYDEGLREQGRTNLSGKQEALALLEKRTVKVGLWDYLWNDHQFETLFVDLWRTHETQILRLCRAAFQVEWRIPESEVNIFFAELGVPVDGSWLFAQVFEVEVSAVMELDENEYAEWREVRDHIVHGRFFDQPSELEAGCVYLVNVLDQLASWGEGQAIPYDGLAHLGSIGLPTHVSAGGNVTDVPEDATGDMDAFARDAKRRQKWEQFCESVAAVKSTSGSNFVSE